ncbi:MAG: ATP-binding protein [Anaerolineae bacterium]
MTTVERSTRSELAFAEALTTAAAVVAGSLDFEQVLDRILEQVARVVPADTYNIMLIEGLTARIVRWRGYEELGIPNSKITTTITTIDAYPSFREMRKTGEPVFFEDTTEMETWVTKPGRVDHRAYVGAPIRIGNRTEGFINVNSSRAGAFSAEDARRLQAFADHASIALQNARLYEETRRHAAELERRVEARTNELRARTAWSEAILRSTSDGIIVTDLEGRIIQTNPVAEHWLSDGLSPTDASQLRAAIRDAVQHSDERPEQIVELTGLDLELRAAPVSGAPTGQEAVVVAAHDISHLRALDRMRSQFISDVSHELRTPVAAIRLYVSLLETSPPDRRAKYFLSLGQEIARLSKLVESILQISRIEAGRVELNPRTVDLNLVASATASAFAQEAAAKGLELTCHTTDAPLPVHVDSHWLNLAIEKLVDNAISYTLAGRVDLSITAEQVEDKRWALFIVEDSGIGIPEDELPLIFSRFFRGEEARTRQIAGSGLGLTIAKRVIELHGGQLTLESTPGKGTRVTARLPLASAT